MSCADATDLNGVALAHDTVEMGDLIRKVAQRLIDEEDLAAWLRQKSVD